MADENQNDIDTKSQCIPSNTLQDQMCSLILNRLDQKSTWEPLSGNDNKSIERKCSSEEFFDSQDHVLSDIEKDENAHIFPQQTDCTTNVCSSSEWFTDAYSQNNNSCSETTGNFQRNKNCLINQQNSLSATDSAIIKINEIEHMKQQLEIYRKRKECMLKMNRQLESELKISIQKNFWLEQYVTCPYVINCKGKVEFPGKNDLEKRFDCLFEALRILIKDVKTAQSDIYLTRKLNKVLHLPLPRCSNNCCRGKNDNKNKL